jgi:DNA polymerase-4
MDILGQASPLVEQMSVDEAFLDLTERVATWADGREVAQGLQRRVEQEIGLSASLGVATNKLVAKIASDRDKPKGLTVVPPGEEAAFLAPLPVQVLWGVGPVTAQKLSSIGISTVADLTKAPVELLCARFGRHGAEMARQARGIDNSPVITEHELKSVGQERTFGRDLMDRDSLREQLWQLSQGVGQRLRASELASASVVIKMRYSDFATLTRQASLAVPTDDPQEIYRVALMLFDRVWQPGRRVRLLGVSCRQLSQPVGQLPLLLGDTTRR